MNTELLSPEKATAAASRIATESVELADTLVVDSAEMYQFAGAELQHITAKKKQIEELRMSITRPMDEAKKRVMDMFRVPTETLEAAEKKIRASMLVFKRAEDERVARERAAAEAKARAEREAAEAAAAAAAKAAEAAAEEARAAEDRGDIEAAAAAAAKAAEAEARAAEAEAEAEIAEIAPTEITVTCAAKATGISSRETWKAEVVSLRELVIAAAKAAENGDETLLGYLLADTKALSGTARALKRQAKVPGVRFYAQESISVRAA